MGTKGKADFDSFSVQKKSNKLMLLNDNHNSFEHVITSLIQVCGHNPHQAEQCAIIVHHKGECDVKVGSIDDILPKYNALKEEGLTVEIR